MSQTQAGLSFSLLGLTDLSRKDLPRISTFSMVKSCIQVLTIGSTFVVSSTM